MARPRHDFYETEDKLILSIYDKNANPDNVSISFQPRSFEYVNGDSALSLQPLKGEINLAESDYTVGRVKVEVRFKKAILGKWGALEGDMPDVLSHFSQPTPAEKPKSDRKDWGKIASSVLESEKEVTTSEDPNVGGDSTVNSFFQKLYADADEDTRRAMMKSFQESGGTTLSTNWDEVGKGKVEVQPPQGSEWKRWG